MTRRHKYNASPTVVDNIRFASKAEAKHYVDLRNLQRAGKVTDLELQPRYDIEINGERCGYYLADFRYFDKEEDAEVVIDVKGHDTSLSKLKRKLVKAIHGVDVRVVRA